MTDSYFTTPATHSVILYYFDHGVFLCPTEKRKQMARLTVKSSQNVNDPSVKAEILVKASS